MLIAFMEMIMDQLKTQVDASLTVMAEAVEVMRLQFEALAKGSVAQPDFADVVARLKSGTDTLAAAIAHAKEALQA